MKTLFSLTTLVIPLLAIAQDSPPGANLPPKVAEVMAKLAAYEKGQNETAVREISSRRAPLLKKFGVRQKEAMREGDLESALAWKTLIDSLEKGEVNPESAPAQIRAELLALVKFEAETNATWDSSILSKRSDVLDYLEKFVKDLTRKGDLDSALAVQKVARDLKARIDAGLDAQPKQKPDTGADTGGDAEVIVVKGKKQISGSAELKSHGSKVVRKLRFESFRRYRVFVVARQSKAGEEDARLGIFWGRKKLETLTVSATTEEEGHYTVEFKISRPSEDEISFVFENDWWGVLPDKTKKDRNIYIKSIHIEGPLFGLE